MFRSVIRVLCCSALATALCFPSRLAGQNEIDALRASTIAPGGTARSIGIANAFGALGADAACLAINPAGMGLYRTSEFAFTPSFEINTINSTYNGQSASDAATRFYFSNLALILHSRAEQGSNWRHSSFGVVFDRQASNHWRSQAIGQGVRTSILDAFALQANGTRPEDLINAAPFTAWPAYEAFGINPEDTLGTNYFAALPAGTKVDQTHTVVSRGATNNTSFFYSGNYMDQLYVGASVGIVGHRFTRTTTHAETVADENVDLKDMRYREDLTTTGNGLDVKVGAIYRFSERFRAGLAFQSPMWLQLNDVFVTEVSTNFRIPDSEGRTSYTGASPDGIFAYRVNSPWRTVVSAAYIAGANGLVSVDYTYADQRRMRLRPSNKLENSYDFRAENETIQNTFRATHSLRIGTEWRAGNWYFRMGWGFVPDAYQEQDPRHGQALKTYAGGLGYRTDHLGLDLGMNYEDRATNFFQYDPTLADVTNERRTNLRTLVTLSLRP